MVCYHLNISVFIDNLKIIDNTHSCPHGETGKTGDVGTCNKGTQIRPHTRKFHHTVHNKHLIKNIPKNVNRCKRNKYH